MRYRLVALFYLFILALLTSASAQSSLANEQTVSKALQVYFNKGGTKQQIIEQGATRIALTGMLYSLSWGNSFLQTAKREPFYCPPPNMSITGDQAMQILKAAVVERPKVAQQPLGFALIVELSRAFPCPERDFNPRP
jgi:hypothetical protein